MRTVALLLIAVATVAGGARARAQDPCAALESAFPQPGRAGQPGDNAFRPLPVIAPLRAAPGAPGTLSLHIAVDHVSTAPAGSPGTMWIGNYPVTDLPAFRVVPQAGTEIGVVRPEDGRRFRISDACLASAEWGFAGTQWALVQGDTLDVQLASRLDYSGPIDEPQNGGVPCRASNLHTHGLIVSPYAPPRPGLGPQGDDVMDATQPHGSADPRSGTDDCGTALGTVSGHAHPITERPLHYVIQIPGTPGVSGLGPGEHPSGLFWYHPHPHGFSRFQEQGATTGALTVGELTDYACPAGQGTPGHCTLTETNLRVMSLKETQIQFFGAGAWRLVPDPESGFCTVNGGLRHGECLSEGDDGGGFGKWIFTINGVQYPTIRAGTRTEVWRIVNASPNMTWALSLRPAGSTRRGAALPFQVLSRDGVAAGTVPGAEGTTTLMLMPASRAEIAVPPPPEGGTWVLHNDSAQTGQGGAGDTWPEVELARVVWDASQAAAASAAPFAVAASQTPMPRLAPADGLPANCQMEAGDTRLIEFTHRFATIAGVQHEIFGLMAGVRHADGSTVFYDADGNAVAGVQAAWAAGIAADPLFPAYGHNAFGSVCTVHGNVERWEIDNWTGEAHDFHPHQTRFTLDPAGVFQFPDASAEPQEDAGLRRTDALLRQFFAPSERGTVHDTIPVPRGQSLCRANPSLPGCNGDPGTECSGEPEAAPCSRPGIASVVMDFTRDEQIGSFVYHCHILEHEDGGMMADIRVVCPPGDAACAVTEARRALCRVGPS